MRHVRGQDGRGKRRASRLVNVTVGGKKMELYCDTGSSLTIIPPGDYEDSMGKVVGAKNRLKAWGAREYLDVKGMVKTSIVTRSGVAKRTWVYIVALSASSPSTPRAGWRESRSRDTAARRDTMYNAVLAQLDNAPGWTVPVQPLSATLNPTLTPRRLAG